MDKTELILVMLRDGRITVEEASFLLNPKVEYSHIKPPIEPWFGIYPPYPSWYDWNSNMKPSCTYDIDGVLFNYMEELKHV